MARHGISRQGRAGQGETGWRITGVTTVLSIQSSVVFGHVGNAAAVFPLQRLGVEVLALHTVQFSNHPGYGHWTGQVFPGALVRELVDGVAARGMLGQCDAVLSGYMGDADTCDAILGAVGRVRAANTAALYCCDPVIGDTGPGVYVRAGLPELIAKQAVPAADLLTPNGFELGFLAGSPVRTVEEAARAARLVRARMSGSGPRVVLVTSLGEGTDVVDMLAVSETGTARLRTPRLPQHFSGAGDVTAALFLAAFLNERDATAALAFAGNAVHAVLVRTAAAGARELCLVAAQDAIACPPTRFLPEYL